MAKIAILAGEPSGDLIASQLMSYISSKVNNIEFVGVGGPLMRQQGLRSFFDYSNLKQEERYTEILWIISIIYSIPIFSFTVSSPTLFINLEVLSLLFALAT